MSIIGRHRQRLFAIPARETTFQRRGFDGGTPATRDRIDHIGRTFAKGYHAAMEETRPEPLAERLNQIECERRGFGYEGAAMALALLDLLLPWCGQRFASFLTGPGNNHAYMLHVGVGWALARLPRRVEANLNRFDPLLRWLILDGYGFHQGYFHWHRFVSRQVTPKRLSAYGLRAFDQGLGRSLWFVHGAEVERIARRIDGFAPERRSDLWGGVGLACAYAGGVPDEDLELFGELAGTYLPFLAQGVAFAAKARQRAGNPAPHTETACRLLCGMTAAEAAGVTDATLAGLSQNAALPAYEAWRMRVQARFGATFAPSANYVGADIEFAVRAV